MIWYFDAIRSTLSESFISWFSICRNFFETPRWLSSDCCDTTILSFVTSVTETKRKIRIFYSFRKKCDEKASMESPKKPLVAKCKKFAWICLCKTHYCWRVIGRSTLPLDFYQRLVFVPSRLSIVLARPQSLSLIKLKQFSCYDEPQRVELNVFCERSTHPINVNGTLPSKQTSLKCHRVKIAK